MIEIYYNNMIKDNEYYIETNMYYGTKKENYKVKQIGIFEKIIKYDIGRYYDFSYSENINDIYNGRCNGSNTFDVLYTKIYKPTKNKLLFLQILRQKIKDELLVDYIINLFY